MAMPATTRARARGKAATDAPRSAAGPMHLNASTALAARIKAQTVQTAIPRRLGAAKTLHVPKVTGKLRIPRNQASKSTTGKTVVARKEQCGGDVKASKVTAKKVETKLQKKPAKSVQKLTLPTSSSEIPGRCFWSDKEPARSYHDDHWGHPQRDSQQLFEIISLCSQQAGVSWRIVWNKREAYRDAFHGWDMHKIAAMSEEDIDALVADADNGVLHNRRKLAAIVNNAQRCLEINESHPEGLSGYFWSFTGTGEPVVNTKVLSSENSLGTESDISKSLAAELKRKGFKFLGSITLHSFCQQTGIINDHCRNCFKNPLSGAKKSR